MSDAAAVPVPGTAAGATSDANPLRVLAVLPGIDAGAGAEQSFAATAKRIVDGGVDLHLALLTDRFGLVGAVQDAGVVVHSRVPLPDTADLASATMPASAADRGFRAGGSLIERTRWLGSLIDELRPDVVHATLFEAQLPAQIDRMWRRVRLWRRTPPAPLIVTWASTLYGPERAVEMGSNAWKLRVLRWIEVVVGRASGTHFHAVTEGTATINAARLKVSADRVSVVQRGRPNLSGPGQADARARIRESLGLRSDDVFVLSIGRHERAKAYDRLLDAAVTLMPARPNLFAAIAGRDGGDSARLRQHPVFQQFSDRCVLLGHRSDIGDLLSAADIVACTSLREGAAGSLIEAMSAGRAICSVELPSLAGILVDDQNAATAAADRFGQRLADLVDDPALRDRIGAAGRATYEHRFTVDASAEHMAELYRAAATRRL